jgi:sodium transport system permease protein
VRDRRTLAIAMLMGPLLMPALMLGMGKLLSNRISTQMEKPLECRWSAPATRPNLVAWLQGQNIVIEAGAGQPDEAIRSEAEDVILRIDGKFGEQWRGSMPGGGGDPARLSRQDAADPGPAAAVAAETYGQGVGALRLVARGIAPTTAQPLRVSDRDLATPEPGAGRCWPSCPTS